MARVLVIGVAVADFVFQMGKLPDRAAKYRASDAEIVGGGCAANAAVAITRLGGEAVLGARLGADAVGDLILADLEREGVNTDLVQRSHGSRSSYSSVCVDADGERQIVNFRGTGLTTDTAWIANAPEVDAILADTRWTEGAVAALELARSRGVPGIVDAEAPMDISVLEAASHVAFSRDGLLEFCPSDHLQDALEAASEKLSGWVCVTDGANGSYFVQDGRITHIPAFSVAAKDTLGAGDIWHGAFAFELSLGQPEMAAVRTANAVAALKCTTFGGRKGTPTRAELDRFLKETPS
jgi:sulfofructose kinase